MSLHNYVAYYGVTYKNKCKLIFYVTSYRGYSSYNKEQYNYACRNLSTMHDNCVKEELATYISSNLIAMLQQVGHKDYKTLCYVVKQ